MRASVGCMKLGMVSHDPITFACDIPCNHVRPLPLFTHTLTHTHTQTHTHTYTHTHTLSRTHTHTHTSRTHTHTHTHTHSLTRTHTLTHTYTATTDLSRVAYFMAHNRCAQSPAQSPAQHRPHAAALAKGSSSPRAGRESASHVP